MELVKPDDKHEEPLAALGGMAYFADTRKPADSFNSALTIAQLQAQKAQIDANKDMQHSVFQLEGKVADNCIAKGGTPEFLNNAVKCNK